MIELRWNDGVLEQRTRIPRVDANGAFCDFTAWSEWHRVPDIDEVVEPIVGPNIPKTLPVSEE
mgnify:CR=1 FL=1